MKTAKHKKRILWIVLIVLAILIAAVLTVVLLLRRKARLVPAMSFQKCLAYTTSGNPGAIVSVGILQNGQASVTVYGEDARILPNEDYEFEIGSITKTFTAALLERAVSEGKISLDDSIDQYLDLPENGGYPTIRRLITHTSGYKSYYLEAPMVGNFFAGRNSFYGISRESMLARIAKIHLEDRDYPFSYSNFGMSVVGLVLEQAFHKDATALLNAFVQDDLHLSHTYVSADGENLAYGWDWAENDAYLPAGALISTTGDMLLYAQALLDGVPACLATAQKPLAQIHAANSYYESLGIRMDAIGAAWILDEQHGIVWHNGGTGHYASYLGFDPARGIAVAVLTNLPPNDRIPATVLGAKLLLELQQEGSPSN